MGEAYSGTQGSWNAADRLRIPREVKMKSSISISRVLALNGKIRKGKGSIIVVSVSDAVK